MQLKNNLKLSYDFLMQNKSIILPSFIGSLIFSLFMICLMGYLNAKSPKELFVSLSRQNWIVVIVLFIILILILLYVYCLSLAAAFILVKQSKLDWKSSFALARQIMFKVAGLWLLTTLIIGIPILIGIIFVALTFLINKFVGVLSFIAIVIVLVIYAFFIIIRLFFSLPILLFENKSAARSLTESYGITKGRFISVLKIFGVMLLVVIASAIVTGIPNSIVQYFMSSQSIAERAVYWAVGILSYLVNAFIGALITLYIFHSYLDFRKSSAQKMDSKKKIVKKEKKK